MEEIVSARAGLETKFLLKCKLPNCLSISDNSGFYTSPKQGQVYEINRRATLASRIIGIGRTGLHKFCSVIGLASPVCKQSFSEYTKYWEQLSKELCTENMKMAVENAKKLAREDEGLHIDENIIDVLTIFDGLWNSRRWTASRGIVSAIAENTSHVLEVAYKSRVCSHCVGMEERKKNRACSTLQNLDWYIRHESNCFTNHDGGDQVSIFCEKFSLLLQNVRTKIFAWLLKN